MNFIRFSAATTNIFPIANSTKGGQLVTEFNLRSREGVSTPESVEYMIGPSYVHSSSDFYVRTKTDGAATTSSATILEILPGRGVINGHYVESLSTVEIDLTEANTIARETNQSVLKGQCCIGLKVMYSTTSTMAGSVLAENEEEMYEGIQVVVLPKKEFILPTDSPQDEYAVTAHIKLAEFYYLNGAISTNTVVNNYPDKCRCYEASRINNIDELISSTYITKTGLNPDRLYVLSGRNKNGQADPTWCDAVNNLMIWDSNPTKSTTKPISEAQFTNVYGDVRLIVPHKQVDGMTNTSGENTYFNSKSFKVPTADYNSESAGVVDAKYTQKVKSVLTTLENIYKINGKQRGYIDELDERTIYPNNADTTYVNLQYLPIINDSWDIGDYIVVNLDNTVADETDQSRVPSTMYVVLPGIIKSVEKVTKRPSGVQLGYIESNEQPSLVYTITIDKKHFKLLSSKPNDFETEYSKYYIATEFDDNDNPTSIKQLAVTQEWDSNSKYLVEYNVGEDVYTRDGITSLSNWTLESMRGIVGQDYLEYLYIELDDETGAEKSRTTYYFKVSETGPREYSDPIWLTHEIPYATEDTIGGFKNVPDDATDYGYVIRDDDGYLRLIDYALLRTGTLAYQLGESYQTPSDCTSEEIQEYLDEYVNQRIAFANSDYATQCQSDGTDANIIEVTIELSAEDSENTIDIYDIDSRFGTSIYLHINGSADENTTINIGNIEKLRIDPNIGGTPKINLINCNLYYDAEILDRLDSISGLSLWYEKYEDTDPDILINGMNVSSLDAPIISQNMNFWSVVNENESHFYYALHDLTFSNTGEIIGAGIYIKNEMNSNVSDGYTIAASEFELPEASTWSYPESKLTKQIKITGTFITSYPASDDAGNTVGHRVLQTTFTVLTNSTASDGTISFLTNSIIAQHTGNLTADTTIDGWDSGDWYIFSGGVLV
jgi:hypothetical protein